MAILTADANYNQFAENFEGYSDIKTCDTISVDTTFLEDIENSHNLNTSQSTCTSSKIIKEPIGYRGCIVSTGIQKQVKLLTRKSILKESSQPDIDVNCAEEKVQIDFSYLYPHSTSVLDKWETFKLKIIPLLSEKLSDPAHLQQLEKIRSEDKGSDQLIALLLHVLPTIKRKANSVKKICRSTVKESQISFLLHVITANDVENSLEKLKSSLYDRGETLQPIVIAVGYNLSDSKFYVYFDEIKYEMPCCLSAFHTCFKVFHVLNLKYPGDSLEYWMFVQKYFYCVHLKDDKPSPNVLCLINNLK
ncbi:uncharacterized protein LOC118756744 [Rhagoletis pomonella]|uniref:uncharacterized protein LOC118756744 n=1 Tax=Rhagoletis pomonella TaxID=28610 RepID=UPI00177A7616|nr:uncharacterized protein LOC118756744 [Rhagoletis pomonella]